MARFQIADQISYTNSDSILDRISPLDIDIDWDQEVKDMDYNYILLGHGRKVGKRNQYSAMEDNGRGWSSQ